MTVFDPAQADSICRWNDNLTQTVTINVLKTEDERTQAFEDFLQYLVRLAPKVKVVLEPETVQEPPIIRLGSSLSYHAIPTAGELNPFLEALSFIASAVIPEETKPFAGRLRRLNLPADMKVYVTQACPFCPQVVRQLAIFPIINPLIHVTVIDGVLFPEMARKDAVKSVPTVILDGQLRWIGSIPIGEIVGALFDRDPVLVSAKVLKDFLREGNAVKLAEMMLERGQVFRSFPELLMDPEWSVRLGAMVVMEELSETNREMAFIALQPLWNSVAGMEPSVRGDILYLFGILAPSSWLHRMEERLASEESREVREVLVEALEKMRISRE